MEHKDYTKIMESFERIKEASKRLNDAENKTSVLKTLGTIQDEIDELKKTYGRIQL